ncbi:MAG: hypothetical protein ACP5QT_06365 [Brevinematia bacterium]
MKRYFLLILLMIVTSGYSEFNYRLLVLEEQHFSVKEAVWNKDNIFKINGGLDANFKLLCESGYKFENFRIKISDMAIVPFETNGNFTNSLLEGYVSVNFMDFYLDLGKKRILKGKGFLYSPSDFLLKYSADGGKSKEEAIQFKDGFWLFGATYFSEIGNFSFYYFPEISISNENLERYFTKGQDEIYLLSYSHSLDFMDAGIVGAYQKVINAGFYGSVKLNDFLTFHIDLAFLERNKTYHIEKESYPYVGDIYNAKESEVSNKLQLASGLNYVYENLGVMLEYFYNGCGYTVEEFNGYKSYLKDAVKNYNADNAISSGNLGISASILGKKEYLSFSQHYGMLRIYSMSLKNFDLASLFLLSLTDLSGRFYNSISYNIGNITLSGEVFITFGDEYSEFMLYGEKWELNLDCEIVF